MADVLTPDATTKSSTVGGLLTSVKNSFSSLTSGLNLSGGTAAKSDGSTSSTSLLMSPLVWAGALALAVVVYFKKFRKPSRSGVKFKGR